MAVKLERKFDLLVLGAAERLGHEVLMHIQTFLRKDLKWAIVGSVGEERELQALVRSSKIVSPLPAIQTYNFTKETITSVVRSTKVVIVLPTNYIRDEIHAWIIEACARNGTHYIDAKAGETCWLKAMMKKYHSLATASGAIMLSHFNAIGATQDILTFCTVTQLSEKLSLKTKEAICSIPIDSKLQNQARINRRPHTPRDATPPWYLSPIEGRDASNNTNAFGLRKDPHLGMLADSSQSAASNRVLVHRSLGLLDAGNTYGKNFFYNEYEEVPNTLGGIRARMGRRRSPCDYNSWDKKREPRVHLKVIAIADQEGPHPERALADMVFDAGETSLTATLVVQAASTLLHTKSVSKKFGAGFLTPAVLGTRYLRRLKAVGVEIECSLL